MHTGNAVTRLLGQGMRLRPPEEKHATTFGHNDPKFSDYVLHEVKRIAEPQKHPGITSRCCALCGFVNEQLKPTCLGGSACPTCFRVDLEGQCVRLSG